MDRLRILIADDDPAVAEGVSLLLTDLGHNVVACASSGSEAVEMTHHHTPDLVVMDIRMRDMDGLKASRAILSSRRIPILILTAHTDESLVQEADSIGVAGYMVKPFRRSDLEPALALACCRFRQLQELRKENQDLRQALQDRKLVERAKGLLMEQEAISEPEAFRRIQQMSRDRNIPMVRIAEAIVLTGAIVSRARPRRQHRAGWPE